MATHSSILAWRIPWTEEPGGLVHGVTESETTEVTSHTHTHTHTCVDTRAIWVYLQGMMLSEMVDLKSHTLHDSIYIVFPNDRITEIENRSVVVRGQE